MFWNQGRTGCTILCTTCCWVVPSQPPPPRLTLPTALLKLNCCSVACIYLNCLICDLHIYVPGHYHSKMVNPSIISYNFLVPSFTASFPFLPTLSSPGSHYSAFYFIDQFSISRILYKWNHAVCIRFYVTPFTQYTYFTYKY